MASLERYFPPDGRVLLAMRESQPVGIARLKRLREGVSKVKRMYVRPEFRGKGIGRSLLEAILNEARQIGYPTVRLDSACFMQAAQALYRSAGFREIEPYPESEIPLNFPANWIFMEKQLSEGDLRWAGDQGEIW